MSHFRVSQVTLTDESCHIYEWVLTSLTKIETSSDEIRDIDTAILREEEDAATEFPSLLKSLTKKTRVFGNNAYIGDHYWSSHWFSNKQHYLSISGSGGMRWCPEDPPPYQKARRTTEMKYLIELKRAGKTKNEQRIVNEILCRNLFTTRTPPVNRKDGIQWICMEELGKLLRTDAELYETWKRRDARHRGELGTDTPTVSNLNLNANSKLSRAAESKNFSTSEHPPRTTSFNRW